MALIGQIFVIVVAQAILEMFIDLTDKPYIRKLLNIACYAGGLYLLLQFVFQNVMPEAAELFGSAFG